MAEQSKTPQPKRQTNPKIYDAATGPWKIEGYGRKPELRLRLCFQSILESEKADYAKYVEDCKAKGEKPEPQTKYPYIVEATFDNWSDMFKYAETSVGWRLGKMAREGEFEINAIFDDSNGEKGDARFKRITDAEVPIVEFPPERRARTQKSMSKEFDEKPREEQLDFLKQKAQQLGLTLDELRALLAQ